MLTPTNQKGIRNPLNVICQLAGTNITKLWRLTTPYLKIEEGNKEDILINTQRIKTSDRIAVSSKYNRTMEIKNIDPAIVDVKEEIPIIAEFRGDTRILETPNAVFRKLFARLGLIKLHSIDLASTENHLNFQEHRIHAIRRTIDNTQAILS